MVDYGNDVIHLAKEDNFIWKGSILLMMMIVNQSLCLLRKKKGKASIVFPYDQELVSLYYKDFAVIG